MGALSDADVPLVHTCFTCTPETADALAKERARQVLLAPARWAIVVLLSLFEGFAFSERGRSPAFRDGLRAQPRLALGPLLRAAVLARPQRQRPRGVSHVGYGELKSFAVHTRSAIYTLGHQPLLPLVAPRELFSEPALALIRPHVKIRGER